ncbi:Uncharacterized protein TCM_042582 [Theobroma cacao]|uniref:Uncharacterized protein n=1 Tax=Theobroma cacao TaxID=3641 RepID=A0A061FMF9_THECC|nr:Uncharacterized protein TCM_042582 [Theobroma cacao]
MEVKDIVFMNKGDGEKQLCQSCILNVAIFSSPLFRVFPSPPLIFFFFSVCNPK